MKHATQQAPNLPENDLVAELARITARAKSAELAALISDYYAGRMGASMLAMNAYMLGRKHEVQRSKAGTEP